MLVTQEQGIVAVGQDKNIYLCDWLIVSVFLLVLSIIGIFTYQLLQLFIIVWSVRNRILSPGGTEFLLIVYFKLYFLSLSFPFLTKVKFIGNLIKLVKFFGDLHTEVIIVNLIHTHLISFFRLFFLLLNFYRWSHLRLWNFALSVLLK
jgi:hypothetical protein